MQTNEDSSQPTGVCLAGGRRRGFNKLLVIFLIRFQAICDHHEFWFVFLCRVESRRVWTKKSSSYRRGPRHNTSRHRARGSSVRKRAIRCLPGGPGTLGRRPTPASFATTVTTAVRDVEAMCVAHGEGGHRRGAHENTITISSRKSSLGARGACRAQIQSDDDPPTVVREISLPVY